MAESILSGTGPMLNGIVVRMTEAHKKALREGLSAAHVDEFGDCIGVVLGPVDFGTQQGPELDVRWVPSGLKYGYLPEHLEVVSE